MLGPILEGFSNATSLSALAANAAGTLMGIVFGALPGLTATMGIALLIPMTFGLPPVVAFSAMLGVYCGGVYAGTITAILIGTPGTAGAAAALLEGPKLTAKGMAGKALAITTIGSSVGGLFSCAVLIFVAPQLAKIALSFGPPEYFALAVFGISVVSCISSGAMLKGIIAAAMGLLLATIGQDPISGAVRGTFDIPDLYTGIALVPALIGFFAVYQVITRLESVGKGTESIKVQKPEGISSFVTWQEVKDNIWNFIRSSCIGTFIGIIPATGGGVASFIAYAKAKQASKTPERFGTGVLEGLAATESANNAVTGGALIPTLTLGIPGDVVTAVILGGLMVQGLIPGPLLFRDHPSVVYGLFFALIFANIFMLIFGLSCIRAFSKLLDIPEAILMPIIIMLCVVGAYSIGNNSFDVIVMGAFGLLGYIMIKTGFPLPPLLLAMILSPMVESNFRRAMLMSKDSLDIFFTRPIACGILLLTLVMIAKNVYDEYKITHIPFQQQ